MGYFKKTLIIVVGSLSAFTLGVAGLLYYAQDSIIYLPSPPGFSKLPSRNPANYRHPGERGIPYEDLTIVTEDNVKLHGWFMKQADSHTVPTLVFFHENAGNIGYRLDYFERLYNDLDVNIFAVSYRGYGFSESHPTEAGIKLDGKAILKYVFEVLNIDRSRVFLLGRSLGGAVAINSASAVPEYPVSFT